MPTTSMSSSITQHTEENCLASYQRDNVAPNVGSRTAYSRVGLVCAPLQLRVLIIRKKEKLYSSLS